MTVPEAAEPGVEAERDQARVEARGCVRRGRLVTAVVAALLVAVVVVVASLGGFRVRKDLSTRVAVGSAIATGPFEVTVDKATVQQHSYDQTWAVVVTGTARTTGDASVATATDDQGFVYARAQSTREVQPTQFMEFGSGSPGFELGYLTPGLPPVPWTLSFSFTRPPGAQLLVVVFDQEYAASRVYSDRSWTATSSSRNVVLDLQELPAL